MTYEEIHDMLTRKLAQNEGRGGVEERLKALGEQLEAYKGMGWVPVGLANEIRMADVYLNESYRRCHALQRYEPPTPEELYNGIREDGTRL